MARVAALMISGQLSKLTGVPVHGEGFVAEVSSFAAHIGLVDWATVALGGGAGVPVRRVLAVAAGPGATAGGVAGHGGGVVRESAAARHQGGRRLHPRPPDLGWPATSDLMLLALPAVGVLLVGYTDFILTARAFETTDSPRVDANQELFALGTASVAAARSAASPISSSGSRTALARAAGAHTQVYSLVSTAATLVVILVLGPLRELPDRRARGDRRLCRGAPDRPGRVPSTLVVPSGGIPAGHRGPGGVLIFGILTGVSWRSA